MKELRYLYAKYMIKGVKINIKWEVQYLDFYFSMGARAPLEEHRGFTFLTLFFNVDF